MKADSLLTNPDWEYWVKCWTHRVERKRPSETHRGQWKRIQGVVNPGSVIMLPVSHWHSGRKQEWSSWETWGKREKAQSQVASEEKMSVPSWQRQNRELSESHSCRSVMSCHVRSGFPKAAAAEGIPVGVHPFMHYSACYCTNNFPRASSRKIPILGRKPM